jgi:hypothetical protein
MVYAMFSIGILGFLVWSLMALLYCELKVINLAICWNSLILIGTLYSKNLIMITQSAGNYKNFLNLNYFLKTSETTRGKSFNFYEFYFIYKQKYHNTNNINNDWLAWFIGFIEGDGAILSYNNRLRFVLTQKESNILYHIQKILGFGTVTEFPQGRGTNTFYRFIVEDKTSIFILAHLFNGNLVLPHRQQQLAV